MEKSSGIRTGLSSIAFQQIQCCELKDFRKIGSGGFGIVYKAKHLTMRDVAVKQCRLNSQTEVRGLAKPGLNTSIVQILGWIQPTKTDGCSYIVMEYMTFGSLKKFSRKLEPFPDYLKIKMVSDVIGAMHFLHNKNMIHRDLKLENIFVGEGLSVKVGDLGCATWNSVADSTEATAGTLTHMAPELLDDVNVQATKMSDVYSFGITLWELSTGRDPYEYARDAGHVSFCVMDGQRPDMKDFPKNVPPIMKDMMERAWDQTPAKRPTFLVLEKEIEKEYADNYKKNLYADRPSVFGQLSLIQRMEEESSVTCPPPWGEDIIDSRLPKGNVSMLDGAEPGPLRSFDQPTNGSIPEKKPVAVSDPGNGELPGESKAMAYLRIDVGQKSVQAEPDTTEESLYPTLNDLRQQPTTEFKSGIPTQESQHKSPDTSKPASYLNHQQSQQQTGYYPQQYRPFVPDPWSGGIPTQQSQHKSPETSKPPYFHNQSQSQQQTGYYPQQNRPIEPDQRSQGCTFNISGQGNTIILADRGGTVTTPESQNEEKGVKQLNNSDTMHIQKGKEMNIRQDIPTSSNSESDALDPKLVEIMNSKQILSEGHINKVASEIGSKWKELGRELGLTSSRLQNIQYDYSLDGQREMAFQVMLKWKQMKGRATKGELARVLVEVGLLEVVSLTLT